MADSLPYRTLDRPAGTWYRVHSFDVSTGRFGPTVFNDSGKGNARFSPLFDPATNAVIPTMYAVSQPRGAIAEILLHRPIRQLGAGH